MKKKKKIFDWIVMIILIILSILIVVNLINLSNIENLIRLIIIGIIVVIPSVLIFIKNKKPWIFRIFIIITSCLYIFLNYNFYRVYSSLDNITTVVDTKTLYLVSNDNYTNDIKNISDDEIGIMEESKNKEFYEMAEEVLEINNLNNDLLEYEDYIQIINDLLNEKIKYAFLPQNYESIYNANSEEQKDLNFKILLKKEQVTKIKKEEVSNHSLTEPFSILLIGTDVILDSYNADTLMLLTVNPKTLNATMLSIPRDTYATIACTGGKHKINASGWYGDKCVVDTVSKYLDLDIDYYAKINFFGIVELVDELGGVEIDVPYSLCEQNSKRQFGENMVYVDSGLQTLNGEQALALSRNRHYWTGLCPEKYTTDGERSDITRGKNQQLVIQGIVNKLIKIRDLNKFYNILDIIGDNMTTNMSNETILSFYNVAKDIVNKLDGNSIMDVVSIERLNFKSYSTSIYLSGLQLSMIVNYQESIDYISEEMKKNLGLIHPKIVKTISFDINDIDTNNNEIKYNKLSTNLQLFPNFIGKSLTEAFNYCNSKGLKCKESNNELNGTIISQSIEQNTDISTIRNKTITFEVLKKLESPNLSKPIKDIENNPSNNDNNDEKDNIISEEKDDNITDNESNNDGINSDVLEESTNG